jgi:hypothetical protein
MDILKVVDQVELDFFLLTFLYALRSLIIPVVNGNGDGVHSKAFSNYSLGTNLTTT